MTDEETVRAAWDRVLVCDGSYRSYPRGTILINWANHQFYDFLTWAAAAEFTRERQEEIRQLRLEISSVRMDIDIAHDELHSVAKNENFMFIVRQICRYSRILSRLESTLADLREGLK